MYRLYVDEVGNDDLGHLEDDNNRFLSLTGLAMRIPHARDDLKPKFDWIKANIFEHDPDAPLIFHRSDIVQRKRAFGILNDDSKRALFDKAILKIVGGCDYRVITALIDKRGMVNQPRWTNQHPYHYLMEILVEKYAQFLERAGTTGDIMPEGRMGGKDQALQSAYDEVRAKGTFYVKAARIAAVIPSPKLKFRYKPDNISGLQLCDLLAHPSHILTRSKMGHEMHMGDFCVQVAKALWDAKYDRGNNGSIVGYGMKWLP